MMITVVDKKTHWCTKCHAINPDFSQTEIEMYDVTVYECAECGEVDSIKFLEDGSDHWDMER